MKVTFWFRPKTGTGRLAMRVNGDFHELRSRVRERVVAHIREQEARRIEEYRRIRVNG